MMQLVQEPSGSYKLVQLSSADAFQHEQHLVQEELIIKEEFESTPKKRMIVVGINDGMNLKSSL